MIDWRIWLDTQHRKITTIAWKNAFRMTKTKSLCCFFYAMLFVHMPLHWRNFPTIIRNKTRKNCKISWMQRHGHWMVIKAIAIGIFQVTMWRLRTAHRLGSNGNCTRAQCVHCFGIGHSTLDSTNKHWTGSPSLIGLHILIEGKMTVSVFV